MAGTSEQERETLVQMLLGLQTGCDEQYARRILKKHDWNADQAAAALLDIASANEQYKTPQRQSILSDWVTNDIPQPTPARPNSVIDLTGDDDDDTEKAIEASMETQTMFGPGNRIDSPQQWGIVPSNAPTLSQEDQALSRALAASLSSSFVGAAQEPYEEPSDPAERIRKDGWPVALRITNSAYCYVPVVLQCVLNLPKVYDLLMNYNANYLGTEDQHFFAGQYQRIAAMFPYTVRAYMVVDDLFDPLNLPLPVTNQDPLPGLTLDYCASLANQLEQIPRNQDDEWSDRPLMVFQGGNADADINEASSTYASGSYIDVIVPSPLGNDMVSCLAYSFSKSEVCLTQLCECLVFAVRRQDDIALSGTEKAPLKYPPRIYLDRFMQENAKHANELRDCQEGMQHEIQSLATDRQKLSNWKNEDTLAALRSSVHYLEHLADDGGDPRRKEAHERSKLRLLNVIKQVEANMQSLDTRIKELTTEAEELFDKPDLQQHGYDLCGVAVHDGLPGRNHVYSYTKDRKGSWWKILDYQVSEVTEDTVLNDHTGLHLGAGPILLFYSRIDYDAGGNQLRRCPRVLKDLVLQDNAGFLTGLPPEVVSLRGPDSQDQEFVHEISHDDMGVVELPEDESPAS